MKLSYIINTAALDPWVHGSNPHRSAAYKQRAALLRDKVLPTALAQGFDEIIIAGNFEEHNGCRYVPVQPRYRDRRDALVQREIGARYATGDILIFGHDDHMVGPNFAAMLRQEPECSTCWDLIVPKRIHGITGAAMNNGFEDGPGKQSYMGGHILIMKRWLWAEVPWTVTDTEYWDTTMTRLWQEAGAKIRWSEDYTHIDIEAGVDER